MRVIWRSVATTILGKRVPKWRRNPDAKVPIQPVKTRSSTVEHLLARVGPRFLLLLGGNDPRRGWLDEPRDYVVNGGHGRGILLRQTDAFFFVSEVTACQLR
jgi:hypothetical protein